MAAAVLVGAAPALADQRYASPTGSGVACTAGVPCDLRTAIESASGGDEVILSTGTYPNESAEINTPPSLDLHGELGAPPPLLSFSSSFGLLVDQHSSVRDVRIEHSVGTNSAFFFLSDGVADRVQVRSEDGQACAVFGTLTNSVCSAEGVEPGVGTQSGGDDIATLRNVTAHSGGGPAIDVAAGDGATVSLTAINTIALGQTSDVVTSTTGTGVATATLSYSNFDSVDNSGGGSATSPGTGANRTAAPLLAGPAGGDFHQLAGSPTIDAGVDDPLNMSLDLDREARSQGARTDVGADEFAPPPPPGGPIIRCMGRVATRVGTPGRDLIRGTRRRDVIAALGGNDVIRALRGNDLVCAGKGRDRVFGGLGADKMLGQAGPDSLFGNAGPRDLLRGGPGRDLLNGGLGRRDRCLGGPGRDRRPARGCEVRRSIP